jgi:hypothetical protein
VIEIEIVSGVVMLHWSLEDDKVPWLNFCRQ